jgi:hypothetical protein
MRIDRAERVRCVLVARALMATGIDGFVLKRAIATDMRDAVSAVTNGPFVHLARRSDVVLARARRRPQQTLRRGRFIVAVKAEMAMVDGMTLVVSLQRGAAIRTPNRRSE